MSTQWCGDVMVACGSFGVLVRVVWCAQKLNTTSHSSVENLNTKMSDFPYFS